jgi:hypothetical protein
MIARRKTLLYLLLLVAASPAAIGTTNRLDLLGRWTVVRELDTPSATNLERSESINPLGKLITYQVKSVSVAKTEYKVSEYTEHEISPEDFLGEFGFYSQVLFPGARSIHWTEVKLFDKGRDGIEAADVLYVNDKEIVLDWHGIYFLAVRAKNKTS